MNKCLPSGRRQNRKAPFGTYAKHSSTQTSDGDIRTLVQDSSLKLSSRKNSIRNSFYKQPIRNSSTSNTSQSKKYVQTLLIKPRYQSTPERDRSGGDPGYDTDCDILVENVTPIKPCNRSSIKIYDSSDYVTPLQNERIRKLENNIPSRSTDQSPMMMLSLDETFLKSVDLDQVEESYLNNRSENSSRRAEDNREERSHSPDVFACEVDNDCQNEQRAETGSQDCFVHPSTIRKSSSKDPPGLARKFSKKQFVKKTFSQCSQSGPSRGNTDSPNADLQWDIGSIDWGNDSLMNRALTPSVLDREARGSGVNCNKRPGQVIESYKSAWPKKSKQANDASNKVTEDKENVEAVGKQSAHPGLNKIQPRQENCFRNGRSINMNNGNEVNRTEINTNRPKSSDIPLVPGKQMSAAVSRVRRSLITNARSPVTNRRAEKHQDSFLNDINPLPDTSANFELGPFFGLPSKVKVLIEQYKGIRKLYDWQEECLNLKAVQDRKNLVYALPTSGGKTLVAEILILKELLCAKRNVLFVLPYVSIVQEKVTSLAPFALALDFLVEEYAAGKGRYPPKKRRRKQSVYIATIEKAHGLVNSLIEMKRISELGLVVVDELHLLGEGMGRGATLEGMLTKLMFCCEGVHVVGMSATIGNIQEIATFLRAEIYSNNFRPVELKEYIKCEDKLWAVKGQVEENDDILTEVRKINCPYAPSMVRVDPDRVGALVMEVVPKHSCLVFCATKKGCENVASMIAKVMPREMLTNKMNEKRSLCKALSSEAGDSMCPVLKLCIPFGVAYHHAGLTADERRLLEDAYRASTLCCICCTSTLAAGVNLPAKRVLLRSPYVGREFISLSQYKQMVGRAGRAGLEDAGESILLCRRSEIQQVTELLMSEIDVAVSTLHTSGSRGLPGLVLSSVGLGVATSRSQLHQLAACSLLSVQAERLAVSTDTLVDQTVRQLFRSGILQVETQPRNQNSEDGTGISDTSVGSFNVTTVTNTYSLVSQNAVTTTSSRKRKKHARVDRDTSLKITSLGKAAMKGSIEVQRANQLYQDLVVAQSGLVLLSCLYLLYLVTPYESSDYIKPVPNLYFAAYSELNRKDIATARVLGLTEACMLQIMKGQKSVKVSERVINRFYLTLILNDLWNHKPVWEVSQKYFIPRGTLQNLMTSAASFASCVLHFCEELEEFWAFKELLTSFTQRLSHCCSADLLPLMDLPAVKIGRARLLYNAGFKTLKDVANAEPNALVQIIDHLPRNAARKIVAAAKLLLIERAESLREEADEVMDGLQLDQS